MRNAQEWLDSSYPFKDRKNIKKISNESLFSSVNSRNSSLITGTFFDFRHFENLTTLNLQFFKISINSIRNFPPTIISLNLSANAFEKSTLEPFRHLLRLEELDIGYIRDKESKLHNKWYGSLEPLKKMKNLRFLSIESTDIETGLEYLPKNMISIKCDSDFDDSKCLEIKKILELINYNLCNFNVKLYDKNFQIIKSFENSLNNIKKFEQYIRNNDSQARMAIKKLLEDITQGVKFIEILEIRNRENKSKLEKLEKERAEKLEKIQELEEITSLLNSQTNKHSNDLDTYRKREKITSIELEKEFEISLLEIKDRRILTGKENKEAAIAALWKFLSEKLKQEKNELEREIESTKSNLLKEQSLRSDCENQIYKLKQEKNELEREIEALDKKSKQEAAKLNLILFVNGFAKRVINLPIISSVKSSLPFDIERTIDNVQGGIFVSRMVNCSNFEFLGFSTIVVILIITLYELIIRSIKKLWTLWQIRRDKKEVNCN